MRTLWKVCMMVLGLCVGVVVWCWRKGEPRKSIVYVTRKAPCRQSLSHVVALFDVVPPPVLVPPQTLKWERSAE